jgi:hypothetical protein
MTPHLVRFYKPATSVLVFTLAFAPPVKTGMNAVWASNSHNQSMAGSSQAGSAHHGHGHGKLLNQPVVDGAASSQGSQGSQGSPASPASQASTQSQTDQTQSESTDQTKPEPSSGLTPNGFPLSNENTADHIEDEIKRQRALDVSYRHGIARELLKNWHPGTGGYVAYLVGLSKTGQLTRCENSASSGDEEAASKAIKATHFPPLPRGIAQITYSIDFKGLRTISIAQYTFTKDSDEEKIPVNLNDAALEVTERKPQPATAADASKKGVGTTSNGTTQPAASGTVATNNNVQQDTKPTGAQSPAQSPVTDIVQQQPAPQADPLQAASSQTNPSQAAPSQTSAAPVPATASPAQTSPQVALSQPSTYKLAPPQLGSAQSIAHPPASLSARQQGQPAPADLLQYQKAIESQIPAHIAPEQELSVWDAATTFTIGPDGKVKEQKIKRTSGSQRVDSSVTHAIAQAAPSVNLTATDNAEFQANVAFNGIVDGKVVKNAQPTCTVQLVNW